MHGNHRVIQTGLEPAFDRRACDTHNRHMLFGGGGGRTTPELKVLVVDDELDVRTMVALRLRFHGYDVEQAATGQEALDAVFGNGIDIVVLDQRMPGLSGVETARALREGKPELPIVLYSAFIDESVKAEAKALGVPTLDKGEIAELVSLIQKLAA